MQVRSMKTGSKKTQDIIRRGRKSLQLSTKWKAHEQHFHAMLLTYPFIFLFQFLSTWLFAVERTQRSRENKYAVSSIDCTTLVSWPRFLGISRRL